MNFDDLMNNPDTTADLELETYGFAEDVPEWALGAGRDYGLEFEVAQSYYEGRHRGMSVEEAAWYAVCEWDV